METKIIFPEDDDAVRTMQGWVCRRGFFHATEEAARFSGATHSHCRECNAPCQKGWAACAQCLERAAIAEYAGRPYVEWDGTTPLYSEAADQYLWYEEDIIEMLEDAPPGFDLRLVLCAPAYAGEIDPWDHYFDEMGEDGELPEYVREAFEALNEALRARTKPLAWFPTKQAVRVRL